MLSKNQLKLITSLHQKKYRNKHGLFIAEGIKVVNELLDSNFNCTLLCSTNADFEHSQATEFVKISESELRKISTLKTPNQILGVFEIPSSKPVQDHGFIVALDGINDPGNLGTIIRLCDWYGVEQLICSLDTVDCYNSKVVQSSMGSLTRLNINYIDLKSYLENTPLTTYGSFMKGESVYMAQIETPSILIMGNEANGISKGLDAHIDHRITIPRYTGRHKIESLNVATATAILLNEFRRH